jgi:hypothetical protein
VRCFPRFENTTTGAKIRLFRVASPVAALLDTFLRPDATTDMELEAFLEHARIGKEKEVDD